MRALSKPLLVGVLVIIAVCAIAFSYYRTVVAPKQGGVDYTKYKRVGGYGRHSQW